MSGNKRPAEEQLEDVRGEPRQRVLEPFYIDYGEARAIIETRDFYRLSRADCSDHEFPWPLNLPPYHPAWYHTHSDLLAPNDILCEPLSPPFIIAMAMLRANAAYQRASMEFRGRAPAPPLPPFDHPAWDIMAAHLDEVNAERLVDNEEDVGEDDDPFEDDREDDGRSGDEGIEGCDAPSDSEEENWD